MSIEAMKQALEALELHAKQYPHMQKGYTVDAITALRQAIEQAEKQEAVTWVDLLKEASQIVRDKVVWKRFIDGTPMANDIVCWMADFAVQHAPPTAQREWVGLTGDEIEDLPKDKTWWQIIRAAEEILKEKNT